MYDIIVVGGGPAGLTAAIYGCRGGKSVLVLEKETFGGQIATSPKVENYPSINSISGIELADRMLEHATFLGAEVDIDEITHIEKKDNVFNLTGEYGTYQAKAVILALGCKHRMLEAKNIEKYYDSGISYCAVCDGDFYKGQDVCLIGDANTALQYGLLLSGVCNHVDVCTLFDRFFGEEPLIEALKKQSNVTIHHNYLLEEVFGDEALTGLRFKNTQDHSSLDLKVSGLFIAIGQVPNNDNFQNVADLDENGYFYATENCETKTSGLFVAGDCRAKALRQVSTACGDAAVAAQNAIAYLAKIS